MVFDILIEVLGKDVVGWRNVPDRRGVWRDRTSGNCYLVTKESM